MCSSPFTLIYFLSKYPYSSVLIAHKQITLLKRINYRKQKSNIFIREEKDLSFPYCLPPTKKVPLLLVGKGRVCGNRQQKKLSCCRELLSSQRGRRCWRKNLLTTRFCVHYCSSNTSSLDVTQFPHIIAKIITYRIFTFLGD